MFRSFAASLALMIVSVTAFAQDPSHNQDPSYNWELARDRDGIQIYKSEIEGSSIKAVKSVTIMQGDMAKLVDLLRSPAKRKDWDPNVGDIEQVKQINSREELVYMHMKLPFPVKDRDMVSHIKWQALENGVAMRSTAITSDVPQRKKRVRVTIGYNHWDLVKQVDGSIKVTTIAHLDPAGPIPAWLINALSVDAPFDSLNNLRSLVAGNEQ